MSNFVIGDVQSCYDSLQALLEHIQFDAKRDTLWFAGDLINRGPRTLDTLRFIKGLGESARCVLGNHDLHALAVYAGFAKAHRSDTLHDLLASPEIESLMDWIRQQSLVLQLPGSSRSLLVHSGLLPQWSTQQALELADEVHQVLSGGNWMDFMAQLYGNQPDAWSDDLRGIGRLRLIVNVCTRMRMLYTDTRLDFKYKNHPDQAPEALKPWYSFPTDRTEPIVFGHWSTVGGYRSPLATCLDTGCVWGGQLTALRLEDQQLFQVNSIDQRLNSINS